MSSMGGRWVLMSPTEYADVLQLSVLMRIPILLLWPWSLPPGTPTLYGDHKGGGARMPFRIAQTPKSGTIIEGFILHICLLTKTTSKTEHESLLPLQTQMRFEGFLLFLRWDGGWRVGQELDRSAIGTSSVCCMWEGLSTASHHARARQHEMK